MATPLMVVAAVLGNGLIAPHLEYRSAMRSLEKTMGTMTGEVMMVNETLDEKLARLRTLRSELTSLRAGLFTWEECGLFAHDLEILAREAGCTVGTVDLMAVEETPDDGETETPPAVRTFRAEFVVSGRHDRVVALLQRVQAGRRKVRVNSCGLEIMDRDGERVEARCGLTIHATPPSDGPKTADGEDQVPLVERVAVATGSTTADGTPQ